MSNERTVPKEHMLRLELAARAVELVPAVPGAEHLPLRAGLAGEVPLALALREDGTLELRAEAPLPLLEGLEARRDARSGPQVRASNPAAARRLWGRAEVRQRLEALFDIAPLAWISGGAVFVELPPEVDEEQIRGVVRAAHRAASTLAQASQELTRQAEQSRAHTRSAAPAEEAGAGRRFIPLTPEVERLRPERREALVAEAVKMFFQGAPESTVWVHLVRSVRFQDEASSLLDQARKEHDAAARMRGVLNLLVGAACGAIAVIILMDDSITRFATQTLCLASSLGMIIGLALVLRGIARIRHGGEPERETNNPRQPQPEDGNYF